MSAIVTEETLILKHDLFGGEFEFIQSGFNPGQYNMDFDMGRTNAVAENKALPMFRLYGWNPWTLSLGAHQKEDQIDKELLAQKGFGLVRRPTGGRAVLHADELTYSVVMNLPDGMNMHEAYKEIHAILLDAFNLLGSGLEFEKSQPNFKDFYQSNNMSVSCFASSARYEIALEGRKIVGSAQRLFGNTLLQHGSILLDSGHEQLADIANLDSDHKRGVLRNYILSHSSTLSEATGRKINYEEASEAVKKMLEG